MSECNVCGDRRLVGGFLPAPCPRCVSGVTVAERDALAARVKELEMWGEAIVNRADSIEVERDQLRADLERMRPVYEAAKSWSFNRVDAPPIELCDMYLLRAVRAAQAKELP